MKSLRLTLITKFFQYWTTGQSVLVVLTLFAAPLIVLGISRLYYPQIESEAFANLEEVARLKSGQIENWLRERNSDAETLLADEALARELSEISRTGHSVEPTRRQAYFDRYRIAFDYIGICLLGLDGKLLLSSGDCATQQSDNEQLQRVFAGGAVLRSPLHLLHNTEVHLDWFVPVRRAQNPTLPPAILVLRTNAHRFLFPLIKAWPSTSQTGESLLIRQQSDEIIFINDLKFHDRSALSMTLPLTTHHLPAATAALTNAPGTTLGIDYRGVAVVAAYRPVTGTDWHIVAKVDHAEVLAPLTRMTRWIAFLSFITALSVILLLRRYSREHQRVERLIIAAKDARIELERHRSNQQLVSLFNLSPIAGIISLAEDGKFIQVNENFKRDFGWQNDEPALLNRTSIETELWPDAATRNAFIEAFGHEERLTNYDTTMMTKEGQKRDVSLSSSIIEINNQRCLLTFAIDITERKAMETHLRKLSLAIEQSTSSIVITNTDACIEYVNDAFVHTTGYSRKEAIGQNPRILQSELTPRQTYNELWATLIQGKIWRGELYNRTKDGQLFIEAAQITPLHDSNGIITNYIAVKEDITEKKRLHEELANHRDHLEELITQRTKELHFAMQRADEANQAKSVFLANMSHEIRTPMNAIVGLTHVLLRSTLLPEQRQQLDKVIGAAGHLLMVINNILDLSKIESSKLELEQIDFRLDTLFDNVHSMLLDAAHKKGLDFKVDYAELPLCLHGDPTRLRQSLLNFASNAIKFTGTGFVIMRARMLAKTDAGLKIRFEVEDSGNGISLENQAKLFNSFQQADTSTTRKYGGTGLGLVITRHLAELMGGEAGVVSQVGNGATFWFTAILQPAQNPIPTKENATSGVAKQNAEQTLRSFAGSTILLADDVEINRELCITLLNDTGLVIETAENGLEALSKATATEYAVILMDMQMPVMDGLEATQAILKLPGRENTAIIAMTANAFEEDRHACERAGMVDFLAKPVEPEQLYHTLAKWIAKSGAQTSCVQDRVKAEAVPPFVQDMAQNKVENDLLPGLDIAHGLIIWNNNVALYQKFLAKFATTYFAAAQKLRLAIESNDLTGAAAHAHKLKGAAANMPLPEVAKIAGQLERALKNNGGNNDMNIAMAEVQNLLQQLDHAMTTALDSIARYVRPLKEMEPHNISRTPPPEQGETPQKMLELFLKALDTDDLKFIEPALEQLAMKISATQFKNIQSALDDFDFRGAEAATRQIASDLGLPLES